MRLPFAATGRDRAEAGCAGSTMGGAAGRDAVRVVVAARALDAAADPAVVAADPALAEPATAAARDPNTGCTRVGRALRRVGRSCVGDGESITPRPGLEATDALATLPLPPTLPLLRRE